MANEVELKLAIAAADIVRLKRHPAITAAASGKPVTRTLVSIYYDTPELALLDHGISLRVRRMSGAWFQAVKSAGKSLAGLHRRAEWEDIIASGHPDFSKITASELTRIFDDTSLRDRLAPIFRTEVRRTEWHLQWDNGDQVELALDVGTLAAGDRREPVCEIELELKHGATGRLFDLALALQHDIPLVIENVSKAGRGYAHYRPQPPALVRAQPPRLSAGMRGGSAFKRIAWECLHHLQGNQAMVLQGGDIEGVHQMRVALRRLRSAITVFRGIVDRERARELLAELRWITGVLGKARDLDVFLAQTLPPLLVELKDHAGLLLLQKKAAHARKEAYREVRTALVSQRYQRLLLGLGAWLENERWRTAETPEPALAAIAADTLGKRYKQLRRHGKRLLHMHPEERHATRIAAKKLRYAAEFFAALYPARASHALLAPLRELLEILGVLNDIAVTETLILQLTGHNRARLLDESLHLFRGWNACHGFHRLQGLPPAWQSFVRARPFWES